MQKNEDAKLMNGYRFEQMYSSGYFYTSITATDDKLKAQAQGSSFTDVRHYMQHYTH